MLTSKTLHKIDSIFILYCIWWSILILLTLTTFFLSILCINHCSNESILPYLLLTHSCLTMLIIILLCYLRHGDDQRLINYLSIFILIIYFLSFLLTTIFTFRRIKYVNNQSKTYCLSYCYPIAISFFSIQIITIIFQLPIACFILILSAQNTQSKDQVDTYV
jgi:hypothetical protein